MTVTRRRARAALSGLCVFAGAVIMLVALIATPGDWLHGYVSEAGAAGQPYAGVYRTGLLVLAAGIGVLGGVVSPMSRLAARLLLAAALLAGASGAVTCSAGCPLPPYERSTLTDLAHATASVVGMIVLAAAMAAVAWTVRDHVQRRMAAAALAPTVPLGAVLGVTMLVAGRGVLSAAVERVVLVVAVSWLIGAATVVAAAQPTPGMVSRRGTRDRAGRL
ncbi:DUF998 domain-containing protein [Mangrovihabitans endophyticus]|uniref:DUF998 domain-containing protein n=1 Tax=Mangrovihabitans endophyticus TaxID=1751298 RepID=A0A8J3BZS1_9ACTN|nr:DUF998 domain-containing protein [Mangrovihabitans endophyticus]GGK90107.1 hypothetical protein GCM10012284_25030 [Mangrovihabitans endophyticus]